MQVTLYKRKDSKFYWIWYYRNGKRIKESTKATNRRIAQQIADHKEEELLRALGIEDPDRLLLSTLIREVILDYRANKKKSIDDVTARSKHLLSFFSTTNIISDSATKERKNQKEKANADPSQKSWLKSQRNMKRASVRKAPPVRMRRNQKRITETTFCLKGNSGRYDGGFFS